MVVMLMVRGFNENVLCILCKVICLECFCVWFIVCFQQVIYVVLSNFIVIEMVVNIIFVEILLLLICLVIFGIKVKCSNVKVKFCVIMVMMFYRVKLINFSEFDVVLVNVRLKLIMVLLNLMVVEMFCCFLISFYLLWGVINVYIILKINRYMIEIVKYIVKLVNLVSEFIMIFMLFFFFFSC